MTSRLSTPTRHTVAAPGSTGDHDRWPLQVGGGGASRREFFAVGYFEAGLFRMQS